LDQQKLSEYHHGGVIFMIVYYGLLILYMQYSKHKWKISQPELFDDWISLLHAEIGPFLIMSFFCIFIFVCRKYVFFILTTIYLICVLDYCTWFVVERPFHPADLMGAIELLKYYPEFVGKMGSALLTKLLFLSLSPIIILALQKWIKKRGKNIWRLVDVYIMLCILGAYSIMLPFHLKQGYIEYNTFVKMGQEILYENKLRNMIVDAEKVQFLLGKPKRKAQCCNDKAVKTLQKHRNIIIYIIETAPGEYYPDLIHYYNSNGFNSLAQNSVTYKEHYTTYPESDRSILSILTGNYPPLDRGTGWIRKYNYQNALPTILRSHGYVSYFISTAPLAFHDNLTMIQGLGFDHIKEIESTKNAMTVVDGTRSWDRTKLYKADLDLLKVALNIIKRHVEQDKTPFLMVLAPQASHAPFQLPPGSNRVLKESDIELLKANADWQFGLIAQIGEILQQFEQYLLIVTGDHGIRHRYESEELFSDPHFLNSISFQVPFWLTLDSVKHLNQNNVATSHIDVTPTIFELLCIDYDPLKYHGRSLISMADNRTLFFLGGDYLPVNGFKQNGRFFMENRKRSIIAESFSFDFNSSKFDLKHHLKLLNGRGQNASFRTWVSNEISIMKHLLLKK
jgi:phosphoglycerol transferase MdoB-like AlkP superfamily enzyme